MLISKEVREQLHLVDFSIAGGASGIISRVLIQPFDVVKIRLMLQVDPVRKNVPCAKYKGVVHAFQEIIREEGVTTLWKGHIPAQILSILYGAVQFSSFEVVANYMPKESRNSPVVQFICGAVAGVLGTVVSFPFDGIRTRLVAQGQQQIYTGSIQIVMKIYSIEGPRGFFKGLSPSLIHVTPYTGAQFAYYSIFKETFEKLVGEEATQNRTSLFKHKSLYEAPMCGFLAGAVAKVFVYPCDLLRKRLQVLGFQETSGQFGEIFRCNGFKECFWKLLEEETIWGLYKGLIPSLIKAGVITALNFSVYEQICILSAEWHSRRK